MQVSLVSGNVKTRLRGVKSVAALRALDPDVLVVAPCGYGLTWARAEATAQRERLLRVAGRAIAGGRA
jgi:hypothetical protein